MKRRMKVELMSAVAVAVMLALLAVYINLPSRSETGGQLFSDLTSKLRDAFGVSSQSSQQVILENIQGELRKGEFEVTIQGEGFDFWLWWKSSNLAYGL